MNMVMRSSKPHQGYAESMMSMDTQSTSNVSANTMQTSNSSLFPKTASYVSDTKSDFSMAGNNFHENQVNDDFYAKMERLNLLAKYNGISIDRSRIIQEHGRDNIEMYNSFIALKPKLFKPIRPGKFARWFETIGPNDIITEDVKMARGVLRKDRFQTAKQLDRYLGLVEFMEMARRSNKHPADSNDKEQAYRVKRVRNKLKHWNAMYKQLHDAITSVELSNYSMREKVQHVNQICSIYITRAERAIDCFYAEPGAHFMLDMVVTLQKKVSDARDINRHYQVMVKAPSKNPGYESAIV